MSSVFTHFLYLVLLLFVGLAGWKILSVWKKSGNDSEQYNLGLCYYYGRGVPQDYEKAVKWFRKAAEYGNAGAQYSLGDCYYYGNGVPQDYGKAVEWFRKAARQGDKDAQEVLRKDGLSW